jgi:GTP 3',8-cyclase
VLLDRFNRVHDYLRIAVTDQCNFRCSYCMPSGKYICNPRHALMSPAEIETIAGEFIRLGVKKIRLTGGEPLLRKDFSSILGRLSQYPAELAITTNGSLVHQFIDVFKNNGVKSVNVSLDSLLPSRFRQITLRDQFSRVWSNIELLLKNDIRVKLNVVALRGMIEPEIRSFIHLTKTLPLHVRFIEFMPFADNRWNKSLVITAEEIRRLASEDYELIKLRDEPHATAKKYTIAGHLGSVAFITTMSCQFCHECNRLRITSEGKLKNCLFGKDELDLLGELRAGRPLEPVIAKALGHKAEMMGGQFTGGYDSIRPENITNRSMVRIGG